MTLVIFVKCQDGCILASDRKATVTSGPAKGFAQEEAKSEVFPVGLAIAGAGDSEPFRAVIDRLKEGISNLENVEHRIRDMLEEYDRTSKINVKLTVLIHLNGTVKAQIIET